MGQYAAHGHPSWLDLTTTDVDAAQDFYRTLLGWVMTCTRTPAGDHHVGSVGDREVAGMMAESPQRSGTPPVWTLCFYVDDIAHTVARIVSAGGRVLEDPFEIFEGTRMRVVADPGGATFALLSGQPQPGPYLSTDIGSVSWFELMTRSPETAVDFYATVFGWSTTTQDAGGNPYTTFTLDETEVAGMIETPDNVPADVADSWSPYFTVDDCAASEKLATEYGAQVILPATSTPVGPFAVLADPQGAVFQIMEYADFP